MGRQCGPGRRAATTSVARTDLVTAFRDHRRHVLRYRYDRDVTFTNRGRGRQIATTIFLLAYLDDKAYHQGLRRGARDPRSSRLGRPDPRATRPTLALAAKGRRCGECMLVPVTGRR